ncbi:hypothetical protein GQF03_02495 [Sneathiella chungangensis]|uniref:Cysteine dioxygenase n=1 Tax=Sneathiella chungangensis TaxID=1418234 RepID=A0A845MBU8_9PROT|nr:cysteine dioxygenase family protein [Sneathiella chungangensis]MZR21192.1 hypothetical protein [Sneathiella chungangensis]
MTGIKRETEVASLISFAHRIFDEKGLSRETLSEILDRLTDLAAQTDLWNSEAYPPPKEGELQVRYLISQDEDATYALYLNTMRPGKKIPPHDHTTWACIAAVEGVETNTIYTRLDDGEEPGKATIESIDEIEVGPGQGVALLPNDIHSVTIMGSEPIRHLHLYGRALETLTERTVFDIESGTCRIMDVGVKTRSANAKDKS